MADEEQQQPDTFTPPSGLTAPGGQSDPYGTGTSAPTTAPPDNYLGPATQDPYYNPFTLGTMPPTNYQTGQQGSNYNPYDMNSAMGYFFDPNVNPYQVTQGQNNALNYMTSQAMNLPGNPLMNPGFAYLWGQLGNSQDMMNNPNPYIQQYLKYGNMITGQNAPQMTPAQLSQMQLQQGQLTADQLRQGQMGVNSAGQTSVNQINPTAALGAAQRNMNMLAAPQVQANMAASGMGRSGAELQGLANAGAQLALPINQQVLSSQAAANQLQAQLGQQVNLANQNAAQQSGMYNAGAAQQGNMFNASNMMQGNLANMSAQQQAALANLQSQQMQNQMGLQQSQFGAGLYNNLYNNQLGFQHGQNQIGSALAMGIPGLMNAQYGLGNQAANTVMNAANFPQQMNQAGYNNMQNFILSLMGATPIPGGSVSSSTTSQNPGFANTAGNLAMIAGLLGGSLS